MFLSDYPRGLANCLWLRWVPAFDALPVAPALAVAFLLARRRFPVSLLCLSTATISAPPPGSAHYNTVGALVADEHAARILSADSAVHAASGPGVSAAQPLDFRDSV